MENKENIQNNNSQPVEQPNFSQIFNVESEEVQNNQPTPEETVEQPKKNIQASLNGQEEVLYIVEEEKEGPLLVPFLLIAILIGMVLALPLISKRIDYSIFKPITGTRVDEDDNKEETLYDFNKSSVRAKIGTLEFTNFVMSHENNEYLLSFTVNNVGEKSYDFSKKYYVVMYDGSKEVYRALIHSYNGLGALSATTLSVRISKIAYDNATKFKLEEIPTASYPTVRTVNTEGDYNILTCTYNYNTIKYYFLNGELHKIYDEYNETMENNAIYESDKILYKNYSDKYKQVNEISSIFIETDTDFRMINEMDLSNISDVTMTQLRTYRFFKYKESIKTVSFELEAQGYKCG